MTATPDEAAELFAAYFSIVYKLNDHGTEAQIGIAEVGITPDVFFTPNLVEECLQYL